MTNVPAQLATRGDVEGVSKEVAMVKTDLAEIAPAIKARDLTQDAASPEHDWRH